MLLAPNDPNRAPSRAEILNPTSRPTVREEANFNYALIALCTGLLTFSIITGLGLVNGSVPAERAYVLMTPLPLALALWFGFGALRVRPLFDLGLILSGVGWLTVFLTLLAKHFTLQNAMTSGTRIADAPDSPLTWLLAVVAIALIAAGAWLSWGDGRAPSAS